MSEKKTFIVTLKENCSDPAVAKFKEGIKAVGGEIQHEYSLIKGFSVKLPSLHVDSLLHKNENVATVEEDQQVHTQ
ncbi:hypothetical protein HPODL_05295 [Ogataea parapolymorpha DL-1]|uniref:Inhibitor I9 domain-containing protein n=1 Tax=Ogataea parapolymorpha (strain ATCC 26012 / BCRC 20466 / JCM 22074 / NRRL Y-7560 / DL-1) TaxID=871575 RepID=W1Q935_OGAPD|nr:hypothetical protein HPODL_05295 [Ogataea parapolymorpha DL-1]ESW97345.1 hypothetical protein HPODL_05295 [Ogataea parapolymorpha DL-1]